MAIGIQDTCSIEILVVVNVQNRENVSREHSKGNSHGRSTI